MTTITKPDVLAALRKAVEDAGSARAYAEQVGLSRSYLSDVLAGRREPGPKVLAALGLETAYREAGK